MVPGCFHRVPLGILGCTTSWIMPAFKMADNLNTGFLSWEILIWSLEQCKPERGVLQHCVVIYSPVRRVQCPPRKEACSAHPDRQWVCSHCKEAARTKLRSWRLYPTLGIVWYTLIIVLRRRFETDSCPRFPLSEWRVEGSSSLQIEKGLLKSPWEERLAVHHVEKSFWCHFEVE